MSIPKNRNHRFSISFSAYEIDIVNKTRAISVPIRFLKIKVGEMLKCLRWKKASLNILLVNDRRIRHLNRRYLNHDRPTDVMAFGQLEGPRPKPKGVMPFLGDIVISLDTTRRQAKIYGNSFLYELCFYLCHGLLHIMGYRDKSKSEAKRMERMQTKILKTIGLRSASLKRTRAQEKKLT